MNGETNLNQLIKTMQPFLHEGEFVFCSVADISHISSRDIVCLFREAEGITIVISRQLADQLQLPYAFVAAWITLTVHSSLEAIGLTAAFSNALAAAGISCNVVAAYYHDHIFVNSKDAAAATDVLNRLALQQ